MCHSHSCLGKNVCNNNVMLLAPDQVTPLFMSTLKGLFYHDEWLTHNILWKILVNNSAKLRVSRLGVTWSFKWHSFRGRWHEKGGDLIIYSLGLGFHPADTPMHVCIQYKLCIADTPEVKFRTDKEKREEKELLVKQRRYILPDIQIPLKNATEVEDIERGERFVLPPIVAPTREETTISGILNASKQKRCTSRVEFAKQTITNEYVDNSQSKRVKDKVDSMAVVTRPSSWTGKRERRNQDGEGERVSRVKSRRKKSSSRSRGSSRLSNSSSVYDKNGKRIKTGRKSKQGKWFLILYKILSVSFHGILCLRKNYIRCSVARIDSLRKCPILLQAVTRSVYRKCLLTYMTHYVRGPVLLLTYMTHSLILWELSQYWHDTPLGWRRSFLGGNIILILPMNLNFILIPTKNNFILYPNGLILS